MDRIEHKTGTSFEAIVTLPKIDLTGCEVRSAIATQDIKYELAASVIAMGPEGSKIRITATAGQTSAWRPGVYAWDIARIEPDGSVFTDPATSNISFSVTKGATL